ncbi:hypothetical protein, variant [Aphanomyces invadans]|uniref:Uncharacterized protein n=1 Tax=Aphanomyces invadans TaxID=157072 RepID=A0A024U1F9_9STRA|nr:hypothetical protein, variant [Aphanomyces invadans]ETW00266.1 hypothetical protein, variant [Aphanomyces invadans]|eukprot:XP_008871291.1 hypothetical protein, variant [Aphanomyces invadans]
MIVRTISTSTAASEHRTKFMQAAARVQMMGRALNRGQGSSEAANHVDNRLRDPRQVSDHVEPTASLGDQEPSRFNVAHFLSNTDDLLTHVTHVDDAVDCTASTATPRMSSGSAPFPLQQGEATPHTCADPSLVPTVAVVQNGVEWGFTSMTLCEIGKPPPDGGTAAVEVNMLAKSMTQCNELNDDMIHRVEHLSELQQEALGTIVHKESLLQVTRQVLDMLHYVAFIGVFVATTLHGRHDDSTYKMALSLMAQLQDKPWPARVSSVSKTFRESVESIEELHKYLLGSFYDVVYSGGSFDGDNAFPPGNAYSPRGVLGGYGEIWGPIRIGQVRVDGVPCSGMLIETSPHLKNESTLCYPEYTASTASHASFGHHGATYSYDSVPPSVEPSMLSHSARLYPAPGFNVYLPNQESERCNRDTFEHCDVYDQLKAIEETKFFDRATRAVFIDMAVYNRNFRDVSVVRLYIEAYPAGGMEPRGLIQTERLYAYSSSHDAVKIIGEIAVLIAATHQLYRIYRAPPSGRHVSTQVHVVHLLLFYVIAACKWLSYVHLPDPSAIASTTYLNFRTSMQYFWVGECVASVVCLLAWIKAFYYLSFVPQFAQLMKTISKASKEMFGLMLIFLVSLVGSAMAFNMAFGMRLHNYHTFWRSFLTLVQVIINKVELEALVETNQVLGPLFFCVFVVLMLFVILNMFIVIITDAYIDAQRELELMHDFQLKVSTREILHHLWHDVVLNLRWIGPHVFQPLHDGISRAIHVLQRLQADSPPPVTRLAHEGTVAAELEAVLRLKQGASLYHAKAAAVDSTSESLDGEGAVVPVESEMSSHDSHDDERVASLFAAIAQEYEEGVAATKVALASLNRAPHEAALHTIQANLDRWLDLAHA